jgi:hypothetical protein
MSTGINFRALQCIHHDRDSRSKAGSACLASRLRQRVLRAGQCLTSGSKPVSVVNHGDGTFPMESTRRNGQAMAAPSSQESFG